MTTSRSCSDLGGFQDLHHVWQAVTNARIASGIGRKLLRVRDRDAQGAVALTV